MDTKLPSMPKYADLLRICKLHTSTSISTKFCKKNGIIYPIVVVKMIVKQVFPTAEIFLG